MEKKILKIKSIEKLPEKQLLIDITCTDDNLFQIEKGVISHNSGNAGAVQHLATPAIIKSLAGIPEIADLKDDNTNIFSVAASMSPFASCNDGARMLMASNQQRHVIPPKNAERPLVMSGYEILPALLASQDYVVRAEDDGIVKEVGDDYIIVRYNNGKTKLYQLKVKGIGELGTPTEFVVKVKPGDVVKKNQILAENKYYFTDGYYRYGFNFYVAIMPYEGFNFEDGIILSESAAKTKTIDTHLKEYIVRIPSHYKIEDLIIDKNTKVGKGTALVICKDESGFANVNPFRFIDSKECPRIQEYDTIKYIVDEDDAEVVDIEIYLSSKDLVSKHPKIKELVLRQIKKYKEMLQKCEEYGAEYDPHLHVLANPFNVTFKGTPLENEIVIVYKVRYNTPTTIGDKFANRHGNKGVVCRIIPDDKMPRDPDGKPFDMIMNPLGIVSRKNPGQLLELYLSRAVKEMEKRIKQAYQKNSLDKAWQEYVNFHKLLYQNHKDLLTKFVEKIQNIDTQTKKRIIEDIITNGAYTFTKPVNGISLKDVLNVYNSYGMKFKDYVYLPEYDKKSSQPVAFGYMYWMKLRQKAKVKYKATATSPIKSKTLQPRSGTGANKAGELDSWSIITYDSPAILRELFAINSDDIDAKKKVIAQIIKEGKASQKDIQKFKPESARLLKVFLAGMMVTDDLDV